MILVTGASGHLGRLTLDYLLTQVPASSLAALVRDPASAAANDLRAQGVSVRVGDYFDRPALEAAFAGIDTLVLVSSGSLHDRVAQHTNAIEAARAAGVQHIAYTSMAGTSADMQFLTGSDHYHTEQLLAQSGIPYTSLRNAFYHEAMPQLLGSALETGQWYYPGEGATLSPAARPDLAEALARVALDPTAHRNQTYSLTGQHAYTFPELAAALSEATGKAVTYVPVSLDDYQAALQGAGVPEAFIPLIVSVACSQQAGEMGLVDGALARLLGREPVSLPASLRTQLAAPAR